jgi:hypothetical protein
MTLRSNLTASALVAMTTLGFLRPTEARPVQGVAAGNIAVAACKQKCLDEYKQNVKDCKKTAKVCDFWILWMCAASHTDTDVYETCVAAAKEVLNACLEECGLPPQP